MSQNNQEYQAHFASVNTGSDGTPTALYYPEVGCAAPPGQRLSAAILEQCPSLRTHSPLACLAPLPRSAVITLARMTTKSNKITMCSALMCSCLVLTGYWSSPYSWREMSIRGSQPFGEKVAQCTGTEPTSEQTDISSARCGCVHGRPIVEAKAGNEAKEDNEVCAKLQLPVALIHARRQLLRLERLLRNLGAPVASTRDDPRIGPVS